MLDILRYFRKSQYTAVPVVSDLFETLVDDPNISTLADTSEKEMGLRKLLEARECFFRATVIDTLEHRLPDIDNTDVKQEVRALVGRSGAEIISDALNKIDQLRASIFVRFATLAQKEAELLLHPKYVGTEQAKVRALRQIEQEKIEINSKILALNIYVGSEEFSSLPIQKQEFINHQVDCMYKYFAILQHRINVEHEEIRTNA